MRVLVCAASRHGSTGQIAVRIADVLRAGLPHDADVEVRSAADVDDTAAYDAVVLGSAVYMGQWLEDARQVAARIVAHRLRLVWLFSSGPIGDPPMPGEEPDEVNDLVLATNACGHRVFAGRLDRHRLTYGEKALVKALRVPDGDFRDWYAIDAWSRQITAELSRPELHRPAVSRA